VLLEWLAFIAELSVGVKLRPMMTLLQQLSARGSDETNRRG